MIEALETQHPLYEVMKEIRRKNIDDVVPLEFRNRNDFVMQNEMQETIFKVAERYSFILDDFYMYYKLRVNQRKSKLKVI